MGDSKPDFLRLGDLTAGLGLHQHVCLIYETQEQQLAAALHYLKAGGERPVQRSHAGSANCRLRHPNRGSGLQRQFLRRLIPVLFASDFSVVLHCHLEQLQAAVGGVCPAPLA